MDITSSNGATVKKYAYFVSTFQSNTNFSTIAKNGWALKYLKCKFFAHFNIVSYFYFSDTSIEKATNTFRSTDCDGITASVSDPVLKYFQQSPYQNNGTAKTYIMEIDITAMYNSLTSFNFRSGDEMVVQVNFNTSFWGTVENCSVLGGVLATSNSKQPSCVKVDN